MKYIILIVAICISFPVYAQKIQEIKIVERSFGNGIDWTCNALNSENCFSGNFKLSRLSEEKRVLKNDYVEIIIVGENDIVKSIAITPKNRFVYNKLISQLDSWNKNKNGYYYNDIQASVIPSTKFSYVVFLNGKNNTKYDINSDYKNDIELIKRVGIHDAEMLFNVIEVTLLNFWGINVFTDIIGNSSYLGYPVLKEDLCKSMDGGTWYNFTYKSNLVLVSFAVLENNKRVVSVCIGFYDDRLYDRTMIYVHKKYQYNNGRYESGCFKCELSKYRNINRLIISKL